MSDPAITTAGRLTRDLRTEICVVGAGIAGLTTAYLAAREGRAVVVVERGAVGDGETARTTAHLTLVLDRRYHQLEETHGKRGARLAADSHAAAIDRMQAIVRRERIGCAFERVSAYLFAGPGHGTEDLEREFDAARRAGVTVEWKKRAAFTSFDSGRCLRFPNQAQMEPLRYLAGLVKAIEKNGGRVVTHCPATAIVAGRPGHVELEGGPTIAADQIVVATGAPVHSPQSPSNGKQTPHRSLAIGVPIPRGSVPRALGYDTETPYHYVRVQPGAKEDLLIVGGEDFETGHADDAPRRWAALERWTRDRFPMGGGVAHRWSGQVYEPHDGLAMIGPARRGSHLHLVTGTSGTGLTYGTIAASVLTDLWRGDRNPWAGLYDPARAMKKGQPASGDSTGASPASDPPPRTLASIARGEGAIVGSGSARSAAFRDRDGSIVRLSMKCTHLGCDMMWNSAEKTWDCTCHGSRFDARGTVVSGPAIEDLDPHRRRKRPR